MERARMISDKCAEFDVHGSITQIHPGPVVTTFEFKPDAGIKYSKITGLVDDLCFGNQGRIPPDRSNTRQSDGGNRSSEQPARADHASRADRIGCIPQISIPAYPGARKTNQRQSFCYGPCTDASSADCRSHRIRQKRRTQLHDYFDSI